MSLTEMLMQSVNKKNAQQSEGASEDQQMSEHEAGAQQNEQADSLRAFSPSQHAEMTEEESADFDMHESGEEEYETDEDYESDESNDDSDDGYDLGEDESEDTTGVEAVKSTDRYQKMKRPEASSSAFPRRRKIVATVKSPLMEASLHGRFRFKTRKEAIERIQAISERFVKSSLTPEDRDDALILWVKGYDLTEEEVDKGCIGNYVFLYCEELTDGRFTLRAQKLEADPQSHPQRRRRKGKHPDWGYYVLRRIKKEWRYHSVEEAYADLLKLAEDFPQVSIPASNKLYTIIYQKPEDPNGVPLFRAVLDIVPNREQGGFQITCKENLFRRNSGAPSANARPVSSGAPQVDGKPAAGYFTSMLEMKRSKRRPAPERRKPAESEASDSNETKEEENNASTVE